ncbi:DNA polymerase III subunit beta [Patescibacteria group bacterium]|nr:DNA polymerase III subunit beta [Patescibacteria group bacterium]
MKFICTQENFNKALLVVSHIAGRSTALPILNNVLIQAKKGLINLSATNLEIGVNTQLRGKVEKEGIFTTQAKLITDYISLLPKKNIEVELKEQNLYINCENHQTYIKGMEANDFPVIPEIERKQPILIKSNDLKQALSQVIFAITLDESRPEISGALFFINNKTLTLVGTDSYRLAEKRITLNETINSEYKVVVPLRTLQEVFRILEDNDESDTTIYINENQILFLINGETELISRLIEGQYPDYQQIIPDKHKTQTKINVAELSRIIKSAALFCKPGINDVKLVLNSAKNQLVISATNSGVGENTITLPIQIEGEENEMVFNYRYLLDGLNNLGTSEAILEMVGDRVPGILKPADNNNYLYLVMPIRQ